MNIITHYLRFATINLSVIICYNINMTKTNTDYVHSTHGFGAVYDTASKILILGSHPSVKSKQAGFFYMHPKNRFWKVLSRLFNVDFIDADIATRKTLLLNNHIAIYDVVEECDIIASSDASIRNVVYADIPTIIDSSQIKHIFLNGQKAYTLFVKAFPQYVSIATPLPSTSPANAAASLEKLLDKWKVITAFL